MREDRLAHTERQIIFAAQYAARVGGDNAANFLERLMPVDVLENLAHAREPAGEIAPEGFAPRRHADGFDEFAVGEKHCFLPRVFEAVGVIQAARTLRQIGGMGDVQHFALGMFELLQRQCSLAAAGAADND